MPDYEVVIRRDDAADELSENLLELSVVVEVEQRIQRDGEDFVVAEIVPSPRSDAYRRLVLKPET